MATSLHSTIPTARYLTFLARTVCHHQVPALPFITLLGRISCSGLMAVKELFCTRSTHVLTLSNSRGGQGMRRARVKPIDTKTM